MKIFLIDYENVNEQGLKGVKELSAGDIVNIFYSVNIKSMPFERSIELAQSAATIDSYLIKKTGKNYLDFQLTTLLGYLICKHGEAEFFIVSKDTGFDSTVDFWKEGKVHICRVSAIGGQDKTADSAERVEKKKVTTKKATTKKTTAKKIAQKVSAEVVQTVAEAAQTVAMGEKKVAEPESSGVPVEDSVLRDTVVITEKSSGAESEKPIVTETDSLTVEPENAVTENVVSDKVKKTRKTGKKAKNNQKKEKSIPKPALPESYRKKVRAALEGEELAPNAYTGIYRAIFESNDKVLLNNALVKQFDNTKGGILYNKLKPIYKEFQEEGQK